MVLAQPIKVKIVPMSVVTTFLVCIHSTHHTTSYKEVYEVCNLNPINHGSNSILPPLFMLTFESPIEVFFPIHLLYMGNCIIFRLSWAIYFKFVYEDFTSRSVVPLIRRSMSFLKGNLFPGTIFMKVLIFCSSVSVYALMFPEKKR